MVRGFANILFPTRCPICDGIIYEEEKPIGYCSVCRKKIHFVGGKYCMKCGKPVGDNDTEYCNDCNKTVHYYTENRAAYIYEGDIKTAMYRFKYMNRRDYGIAFAGDIERELGDYFNRILSDGKIDAVMPIPMYPDKLRRRGYNQAERLAEAVGKTFGIPLVKNRLIRVKNTETMKLLSPEARRRNLNNAFQYIQTGVKLDRILLADDIYTTGATIDSASKVLRSAGVSEIYSVCVCIGRVT